MKKFDVFLKDYAVKLNDDNLKKLYNLLTQRLSGDLAEAIDFLSANSELDRWLSSARGAEEFYDYIDLATKYISQEFERRF